MTTVASSVGGLDLPIPAGVANAALQDPAVVALLDYLAFWLRYALDDKLANMGGPTDDATQVYDSACPADNVFPYNPQSYWIRNPKPALYGWWKGRSQRKPWTTFYDVRERELGLMWVFSQLHGPKGAVARAGLDAAVEAVFQRAYSRGSHPDYGYNGAADGTPIYKSMGVDEWIYVEGTPGIMAPKPAVDARAGGTAEGQIVRYHPAVIGKVIVRERVRADQLVDPDDVHLDGTLTILTNEEPGDPLNPVEFAEVVIPGPPERP